MNLLIFGGTRLVGRHITQAALNAGHQVTIFNRGKTNADLFPQAKRLIGDRDGGLDTLKNHEWDAVIDVNGYLPRLVNDSAELLKTTVQQYVFISSLSVYAEFDKPIDEDSKLLELTDPTIEEITDETYGGLKVLCERVVQGIYGDHALTVRPGYVIGPHDHSDRFPYWVWRAAQGGEMLAPGSPDETEQAIDGRDMGEWIIRQVESGGNGVFNAVTPPFKFSEVLETAKLLSDSDTSFEWLTAEFAKENELLGVRLPMWHPDDDIVNSQRAIAAGMTFRSMQTIVADTLVWLKERQAAGHEWQTGFKDAEEQEMLKKWKAKK